MMNQVRPWLVTLQNGSSEKTVTAHAATAVGAKLSAQALENKMSLSTWKAVDAKLFN